MDDSKTPSSPICTSDTNSTVKMEVEDYRIVCTNSHTLNEILGVAVKHIGDLAEARNLGDRKSQFINRFTEVFKNTLQENVTVNGLPWVVNKDTLSENEKEQQMTETIEALLSRLSKTIEVTAHKRKMCTQECQRIYSMTLKHERQNLRMAFVNHSVQFPGPVRLTAMDSDSTGMGSVAEYEQVCKDITTTHEKLQMQMTELEKIEKDIAFAHDVIRKQKPHLDILYDTGYNSE